MNKRTSQKEFFNMTVMSEYHDFTVSFISKILLHESLLKYFWQYIQYAVDFLWGISLLSRLSEIVAWNEETGAKGTRGKFPRESIGSLSEEQKLRLESANIKCLVLLLE